MEEEEERLATDQSHHEAEHPLLGLPVLQNSLEDDDMVTTPDLEERLLVQAEDTYNSHDLASHREPEDEDRVVDVLGLGGRGGGGDCGYVSVGGGGDVSVVRVGGGGYVNVVSICGGGDVNVVRVGGGGDVS